MMTLDGIERKEEEAAAYASGVSSAAAEIYAGSGEALGVVLSEGLSHKYLTDARALAQG